VNERTEALEVLLMLRPNAWLSVEHHGLEFEVEYGEGTQEKFVCQHRNYAKAMEMAEAAAVAYIERVTGA